MHTDLPVLSASVGEGPVTIVLHAHIDVVPGRPEQFSPWQEGGFLWGRGAYDMKGATAAMLAVMSDLQELGSRLPVKVRLLVVPDEEADDDRDEWGTERLVERGHLGDFVICGEPTDMYVGVQAKGVLDLRVDVAGRSAHSATPWLGTNAILRAIDVYEELLRLPFVGESSEFYERASVSLSRIAAGDRLNKVPDHCTMDIDIRHLPEQDIERIRTEIATVRGCSIREIARRPPIQVPTDNPYVELLLGAIDSASGRPVECVGRDGTNDGFHFIERGIPSVEFGPVGSGHHGPEEKVEIESLRRYRAALRQFIAEVCVRRDDLTGVTRIHGLDRHRDPDATTGVATLRER